jgi:nucleoid DNA-binding protein
MKREELARKLAERSHVTRAEARDQVDELVRKVLKSLRAGTPVEFPGAGRLVLRQPWNGGKR